MSEPEPRDLVVIALSGVQRYITESRTTVDLRSASQIVAHLAAEAVLHLGEAHEAEIVFPSPSHTGRRGVDDGMPNRVVALLPRGNGSTAARKTAERLDDVWEEWVGEVFSRSMRKVGGWPVVRWVSVPAGTGPYRAQWERAQRLLAERGTVRDFPQPWDEARELCTLSPRWRSVSPPEAVERVPHMAGEKLAAANWVKRLWHRRTRLGRSGGFASTNALASAPYRAEVLRRWKEDPTIRETVGDLYVCATELGPDEVGEAALRWLPRVPDVDEAVWLRARGGRWVFPASWNLDALAHAYDRERDDPAFARTVREGWQAASRLEKAMSAHGVDPLSPHLAVLAQDLDSMGRYLSGRHTNRAGETLEVAQDAHTDVSRLLSQVAAEQRTAIEQAKGVVVYAGGDDLLALVPAAYALDAARACQDAVLPELPTASTGLLFFHHDSSLSQALVRARDLLEQAKGRPGKHALGVGFVRHSGARAHTVLPWAPEATAGATGPGQGSPDQVLRVFVPRGEHARVRLSPRLLGDVVAEAAHLNEGGSTGVRDQRVLPSAVARREIRRLVLRHTRLDPPAEGQVVDPEADRALRDSFADQAVTALERMAPGPHLVDEDAVRLALFLRQES